MIAAWSTGLVLAGQLAGLWEPRLIKETTYWFLFSATVMWFNTTKAGEPKFIRRILVTALGIAVAMEFYLNLYVFSLIAEAILLPGLVILWAMSGLGETREDLFPAKRFSDTILALIGFATLGFVTSEVIGHWSDVARSETLIDLALPVWLTIGVVPLVFVIGVATTYESAFVQFHLLGADKRKRRRTKLALMTVCGMRPSRVGVVDRPMLREALDASSFREARATFKAAIR